MSGQPSVVALLLGLYKGGAMLLLRIFSTLTAIAFFFILQFGSAFAQTKINIGVAAMSPRTIPLIIAQEQGLFAKQGLEARIVLIRGAPTLVASLVFGDFEVGYTGGPGGGGGPGAGN